MDKLFFKDALTAQELQELEQYPDKEVRYALIALMRTEGALNVGIENLFESDEESGKFMIIPKQNYPDKLAAPDDQLEMPDDQLEMPDDQLEMPDYLNEKAKQIHRRLFGKYDWLEVNIDFSKDNEDDIFFRVKDQEALLKHFEGLRKSALLDVKLKRSLIEIYNDPTFTVSETALEEDYERSPSNTTKTASMKLFLWQKAGTLYLHDYPFEEEWFVHPENVTRYKTGDVLKAMDADAAQVSEEVYRIFRELDPSKAAPQIRGQLQQLKQDAATAETRPEASHFGNFFQLVKEIGITAQELFRELEREAIREKK